MLAARVMPLTNPRQALARSKFMADDGRPSPWWIFTATDGSRLRRVTEVLISRPISAGFDAGLGQGLCARLDGGVVERCPGGPPAPVRDAGDPFEQLRGTLSRRRVEASLRSKSMELTIVGASTLETESKAVLLCRNVALPTNSSPSSMSVLRSGGGLPSHKPKSLTMPRAGQFPHMRPQPSAAASRWFCAEWPQMRSRL